MRQLALTYAMHFLGLWYKWGGDDPSGFDCSGFVIEILKATGKLPRNYDNTANGLRHHFKDNIVSHPYAGCLVFYENSVGNISHVEMLINPVTTIGASGGGSRTLTEADAIRHNAFIKLRPLNSRSGIHSFVDPFKGEI